MGGGVSKDNGNTMRDKQYTARSIRIDDSLWEQFKQERRKSGLTWNMFLRELLKLWLKHRK